MRALPTIWTNKRPDNEKQTYFTDTDSPKFATSFLENVHLAQ